METLDPPCASSAIGIYSDMASYTHALERVQASSWSSWTGASPCRDLKSLAHTLLQQCVPMIVQRLCAMQEDLVNKIDSQQATFTTTNDCISELVTAKATLSLNLNYNDGSSSVLTTSSPSSSLIAFTTTTTTTTTSATILATTTIYDGLAGGYPVETLVRQWGAKWREDQTLKFFNRCRSIITTINNFAQQHNITIETAANDAEERCSRLNKSLHHFAEHDDQILE
ncbi:hypothetical protein [Absidia glauca]|uniref:Transcription activator GCR1-like domain-containing protein n=1 Tax=Absidia glauca TaxID=4829 RepID=A0A163M6C5_ABSGL|nr:hypothetical protein [Absidia glauca]